MSYYNLTNLTLSVSPVDLITFANKVSGEVLFGGLMVAIFIVLLFGLKRYDFGTSFLASSFACMILSTIGATTGMLTIMFPLAFLLMTAFSGLYLFIKKD